MAQLLATITTPNPAPASIQPASQQPPNDALKPSEVNARDVSAITLDAKAPCEPCLYQGVMKGIYVPIKYAITDSTNKKFYERKGLPLSSDSALFMGCAISAFSQEENQKKKLYKAPSIPLSIHPERNKTFLENIQFIETKVQEFLTANTDALKKERDRIRTQVSGGRGMKVDPKDKEPLKYVSVIKSTTIMKDGKEQEYLNISCEVNDKAYKEWYYNQFGVPGDDDKKTTKKNEKFDDGVSLVMFPPDAYGQNGQLDVKRDADNKVVNGWPVSLEYMVTNKIDKILAIPTFGFSKLFWNTEKNEIRLRFYLNSCIFIQQTEKKPQRNIGLGLKRGDFASAQGSQSSQGSPPAKRQCTEGAHSAVSSTSSVSTAPIPAPTPMQPQPQQPVQPQPVDGAMEDGVDLTDV